MSARYRDQLRQRVCAEALSWLNTPYHHCQGVKGAGVDCAMLLVAVYAACGLVPAELDPRPYPPSWHLHRDEERFLGWLQQFGELQTEGRPEPADVLCWRFGRAYSHGGIFVGEGQVVHAHRPERRVTLSTLDDAGLAGRPMVRYRLKGLV